MLESVTSRGCFALSPLDEESNSCVQTTAEALMLSPTQAHFCVCGFGMVSVDQTSETPGVDCA